MGRVFLRIFIFAFFIVVCNFVYGMDQKKLCVSPQDYNMYSSELGVKIIKFCKINSAVKKKNIEIVAIIPVERGGYYFGTCLQELLESEFECKIDLLPIRVSLYDGTKKRKKAVISGFKKLLKYLRTKFSGDSDTIKFAILIDDIADSGKTLKIIHKRLSSLKKTVSQRVLTATVFYKHGSIVKPDFFCESIFNGENGESPWIDFPHELPGKWLYRLIASNFSPVRPFSKCLNVGFKSCSVRTIVEGVCLCLSFFCNISIKDRECCDKCISRARDDALKNVCSINNLVLYLLYSQSGFVFLSKEQKKLVNTIGSIIFNIPKNKQAPEVLIIPLVCIKLLLSQFPDLRKGFEEAFLCCKSDLSDVISYLKREGLKNRFYKDCLKVLNDTLGGRLVPLE